MHVLFANRALAGILTPRKSTLARSRMICAATTCASNQDDAVIRIISDTGGTTPATRICVVPSAATVSSIRPSTLPSESVTG